MIKFVLKVSSISLALVGLMIFLFLPAHQVKAQVQYDPCASEVMVTPESAEAAPDIEAAITNQWGWGIPAIKIFGRDAAVGEVVTAPLDEYEEKYALRAFEDPLPVHDACPGYGYFRDADMTIISRISIWSWRQIILIRHAGGRGFWPGSEGYIQIIGNEWRIVDVLTDQGPDNSYFGFGINIDEESGRIEWQGRGGCPACACLENDTKIAVVVEKQSVGPTYTPFTSTRTTTADIEAAISNQWGWGPPPLKIFGQDAGVGQVVTATLNEYDEKYALRAFEDPLAVFSRCPGYGYYRDANISFISRITLGQGRVLVLIRHHGARGYRPGSEGYVQLGNDWYIEKVVSAQNDIYAYGFGVRIDEENGTIEWQGRTGCPGCACHEGPAFISVVAVKKSEPVIEASIDIRPETLNRKSRGRWITAYVELPEGYDVGEIDVSTVAVTEIDEAELADPIYAEEKPTSIGDEDGDGIPDLMVKFDRQALTGYLEVEAGERLLTISGALSDGTRLQGSDTIRVIH